MKRYTTLLLLLVIACSMALAQATQWQFVRAYTPTRVGGVGGHGVAVDPEGKVWVQPQAKTEKAGGTGVACYGLYVYMPDGSQASFSPITIYKGPTFTDTVTANSGRGMTKDPQGNIIVSQGDALYRFDYKTAQAINKTTVVLGASSTQAGVDSLGEIFVTTVLNGNPMKIFNPDFSFSGNVIDTNTIISRALAVSKDGNDIYYGDLSRSGIDIYHSDNGSLGPYAYTDSIVGPPATGFAWHPKTKYLWFDAGNPSNERAGAGWTELMYYGIDVKTKARKDSIMIDTNSVKYPIAGNIRGRGIDFTASGDTVYLCIFNVDTMWVQMFRKVPVSVEPVERNIPAMYTLSQNYPNPFNPSTEIQFAIPKAGMTTVKVYDMLGQEVATLVNEELAPGTYKTRLDGSRLASGSYVYMIISGDFRMSKKMLLLK
jgi:Secretion system C-terminal sorting domain